jgi:hypothetical protein
MSGSNAANLPVAFKLEGIEQVQRTLRETTQQFVEQARAASTVGPAVSNAAEAFQRLEQRAAGARGVVNDLRGAMELIGAGGAAGFLGPASSTIGNVADLLGTASVAAGRFGTALATIGTTAATATGLVALPLVLQQVGLGINAAGEASESTAAAMDRWRQIVERLNPALDETTRKALEAANALQRTNLQAAEIGFGRVIEARGTAIGQVSDIDRQIRAAEDRLGEASGAISRANRPSALQARQLQQAVEAAENQLRTLQLRRADLTREVNGLDGERTTFEELRQRYSATIQYPTPIGPEQPRATGGGGGGGGRGRAEDPEAAFARSEALAQRTAQAAIDANQRAQDQIARQQEQATERFERQSIDAFARIGENAADRIGTGLVQGFLTGQGAAVSFGNLLNSVIASAVADLAKLAIINPASNAIFGTSRPTIGGAVSGLGGEGGGMFGGLGDIFSTGSSVYSMAGGSSLLGGSGIGSSISGLLSTNLWGGAALQGPTLSGAPLSGFAGGATLGGALAGIGGGFAVGTLASQLTATSAARRQNGQIGAGIGAAAGFLIGGPVGGLIGGAIGGAGGGLIGPGEGFSGGDVLVSVDGSGKLVVGRSAGKGFDTGALSQQVRTDADSLNALLGSAGLRFDSNEAGGWLPDIGWVGGGGSANPASLSALLARGGATLKASDARGQSVLDRYGGGNNIEQALALAGEMQQFSSALDQLKASATQATDPIGQIRAQFDSLRATAERLGFGLDEVNAAQERAIKQYQDQQRDQAAGGLVGTVGGIAGYVRGLRTANDNSGNPVSRLSAAESSFFGDAGAALNGNLDALGRITNSAETFRTLSRAVYGTGQGYAATEARIAETLGRIGAIGAEQLTASAMDAITARQTDVLAGGQALLVEEVRKLRDELRQLQTNPLAARAA